MSEETKNNSCFNAKISKENESTINNEANSFCTDCQEELNILNIVRFGNNAHILSRSNNFDNIFLPNIEERTIESTQFEPLNEATKSLSQISFAHENHESNFGDANSQANDDMRQIYFFNPNKTVEVGNDVLVELLNNVETNLTKEPLINNKKSSCDKEVQTEPQMNVDHGSDPWDVEFSSETELHKIEKSIKNISSSENRKQSKNHNSNDRNNANVTKKNKENLKPNYNLMKAILLNRQKRLVHLANDIYQLSSYLDGIKKTLASKEPVPATIPPPPAMTGYDSQFDFPNENRFGKLPIQIQFAKVTTNPSGTVSGMNSSKSSSRNGCGLTKLPTKRMNNGKNESATKRFIGQTMSKDGFHSNKENENNERHRKRSIDECSSMYEYNPLSNRTKTITKLH